MKTDLYKRTYRAVDLSVVDYTGETKAAAMGLYFGFYLKAAAVVKVTSMDGETATLDLGAGYHEGQFSKIFKNGDGTTVASIIIFY